jgi:hypothetical protein
MTTSTQAVKPKASVTNLELGGAVRDQRYLIKDGDEYYIFPIQVVGNEDAPLLRFEVFPPLLREGFVVYKRNLYRVTLEDLQRGVVRKSRIIDLSKRASNVATGNAGSTESTNVSTDSVPELYGSNLRECSDQQGSSQDTALEIAQAIDDAWDDQVGALLSYLSEKEGEELEVSETA